MASIAPDTLRDSLLRLALAGDDRASALTLLFLLRAAAGEEGRVVEISPHEGQTLVTFDEPASGAWIAELMPIRMETIDSVLVCSPELSISFVRIGHGDDLVLRARKPHSAAAFVVRETPIEMPGVDLLVAAGCFYLVFQFERLALAASHQKSG